MSDINTSPSTQSKDNVSESHQSQQSSTCCAEVEGKTAFYFSKWVGKLFDSLEKGTEVEPLPEWAKPRQPPNT